MSAFDAYGKYYDLLNEEKEYDAEVDYVLGLLSAGSDGRPDARRILDLGCGTGGHAFPLVRRGFRVHGIDLSPAMIERAETRRAELPPERAADVSFAQADIRGYRSTEHFDAVISLFHVVSYQPSNADLRQAFETARSHLQPGGVFVFDGWYGPAVLTDPPYVRSREYQSDQLSATRTATPTLQPNENVVQVDYEFVVRDADDRIQDRFAERHRLRYLFLPEIELFLGLCGFELTRAFRWMTNQPPGTDSWYAVFVARAA